MRSWPHRPGARRSRRAATAVLCVLGLAASACATAGNGSPSSRVSAWVHDTSFGAGVGTVLDDSANVGTVVTRHLSTQVVHTVCLVLFQDTESAAGNLPTPDERLTKLLAKAYGLEVSASHDCYNAGATNKALLRKSADERRQARVLIEQGLARVRELTGSTVSTTTTTTPGGGGLF